MPERDMHVPAEVAGSHKLKEHLMNNDHLHCALIYIPEMRESI